MMLIIYVLLELLSSSTPPYVPVKNRTIKGNYFPFQQKFEDELL